MSAKAIYEAKGKSLLNAALKGVIAENKFVSVNADTDWTRIGLENQWLTETVSSLISLLSTSIKALLAPTLWE